MIKQCEQCGTVEVFGKARFCKRCVAIRLKDCPSKKNKIRKPLTDEEKEKNRLRQIKWRASDSGKAKLANWRANQRDRESAKLRERRAANPDRFRVLSRSHCQNRRARISGAGGRHTAAQILSLLDQQRQKCANPVCRKPLTDGYHVDHIIPISKGGGSAIENIQLLCPFCNVSKHDKHPDVWFAENGLLALY